MKVFDSFKDLGQKQGSRAVLYSVVSDDVIEQFARIGVLHDQVELSVSLDNLIQLNNPWVPYLLEYFNLPGNSVDIHLVLNLTLFKNLNSYFLLSDGLNAKLYFSEGALAQGPVD